MVDDFAKQRSTLWLYFHSILLRQPYQLAILHKYEYNQSMENLFISSAALLHSHLVIYRKEKFVINS